MLLIWPKSRDLPVNVGDVFDYACSALQSSLSISGNSKEVKLVNSLIECCEKNKNVTTDANVSKMKRAVGILRETADRWNDAGIFLKAVKACGVDSKMDLLDVEAFVSAYQAFPWERLKDLSVSLSHPSSYQLLIALMSQLYRSDKKCKFQHTSFCIDR